MFPARGKPWNIISRPKGRKSMEQGTLMKRILKRFIDKENGGGCRPVRNPSGIDGRENKSRLDGSIALIRPPEHSTSF